MRREEHANTQSHLADRMGINYVICQRAPRGVGNNLAPSKWNLNAPPHPLFLAKITSMVAIEIQGCTHIAQLRQCIIRLHSFPRTTFIYFSCVILLQETPSKIFERRFSLWIVYPLFLFFCIFLAKLFFYSLDIANSGFSPRSTSVKQELSIT